MNKALTQRSKFISLVLRHEPARHGVTLDPQGWTSVAELLAAAERASLPISREQLLTIVADNEKQRFALSADGQAIRARQGHSVDVDLALTPLAPPTELYHGTATRFLDSIRQQGLVKGARHHVHLSADRATATAVGARHGKPLVLTVQSAALHAAGHSFFLTENGVWLVDHVPPQYLTFSA